MATAAQPGDEPLTAERILANARAMAPAISARSAEIEALRRLPGDLVADLRAAGVFRMGRARSKGGPQMSLVQHFEVIEVLAHADPSVGWCVKIGTDSGVIAEFLPAGASARLLPHPDMITAGQFTTAHGTLERVDGGYRLTGRFPFGSGVTHADVVMSGGVVTENGTPLVGPNGLPEGRLAFCRADEIVVEDTWHTHGLRGSGSCHYRADGMFIPEDQALRIEEALFANRDPLYSSGFNWVTTMAAVPLGTARRALDEARALIQQRKAGVPPRPMAEIPQVRETVAGAETAWGAAQAFLYRAAGDLWDELERGTPTVETKGRLALANVNCFRMAAEVTRELFDRLGEINRSEGLSILVVEQFARTVLGVADQDPGLERVHPGHPVRGHLFPVDDQPAVHTVGESADPQGAALGRVEVRPQRCQDVVRRGAVGDVRRLELDVGGGASADHGIPVGGHADPVVGLAAELEGGDGEVGDALVTHARDGGDAESGQREVARRAAARGDRVDRRRVCPSDRAVEGPAVGSGCRRRRDVGDDHLLRRGQRGGDLGVLGAVVGQRGRALGGARAGDLGRLAAVGQPQVAVRRVDRGGLVAHPLAAAGHRAARPLPDRG